MYEQDSDDLDSASWYCGNDDNEEEEIPIWIKNDIRYVSGITKITTCNDVIAALINDEISSGQYLSISEIRLNVDDYILTERWREVESELEGETQILPLWQAWGTAQKEVKFKLKINKKKNDEVKTEKIEKKVIFTFRFLFQNTYSKICFFFLNFSWKKRKR